MELIILDRVLGQVWCNCFDTALVSLIRLLSEADVEIKTDDKEELE